MNAKVKKLVKIVLWTVGILILIPIVLVATLPLWLGPVAKPALNAFAPKFTGTPVTIEKLYLNPYTCNFELGGVTVGNPPGFAETNAFSIGYFNINVDTDSLATDVIVIDNIEISDLFVTWVANAEGKYNLDIIQENIDGAKKKARQEIEKKQRGESAALEQTPSVAKERVQTEKTDNAAPEVQDGKETPEAQAKADTAKEPAKLNKKLIINRFVFKNVSGKVTIPKVGVIPVRVPSIELKDIGRKTGGLDLDNIRDAVLKEFWETMMASAFDVSKALGENAGKAVEMIKGVADSESLKKAGDALKSVKDSESLKKAGDALKDAGSALKGLFGK